MECKKCKGAMPNEAKICPSCGQATESTGSSEVVEKTKKLLASTGGAVAVIGWITIILNCGIYIWSLVDGNSYALSGLPLTDLPSVLLMVFVSIIFVILGNRVKKGNDLNIRAYLVVLVVLFFLTFLVVMYTGGKIGALFLVIFAYLVTTLFKVNAAFKDSAFVATLDKPNYKIKRFGWVIMGLVMVVAFFTAAKMDVLLKDKIFTSQLQNPNNKAEIVQLMVREAKATTKFPVQIDENTEAVDITENNGALRYHFNITGGDSSALTNEMFKAFLLGNVCTNNATAKILDKDINIEYSYVVVDSDKTFFVTITKSDCVK